MSAPLLLAALLLLQGGAPAAASPDAATPAAQPSIPTEAPAADTAPSAEPASEPSTPAAGDATPAGDVTPAGVAIYTPDAPEADPGKQLARAASARAAAGAIPPPPRSRWEGLPRIEFRPDYEPRPIWVERAQAIEKKDGCAFTVDAKGIVRIGVPFVALFDARGTVIAAQADAGACPALAAMVEDFAGQLGPAIVVPPGGAPPRWRYSRFLIGWRKDEE